jgi:hypothetical protein
MGNWASPGDAPNIPAPSPLLCFLYSIPQILLPRNAFPSIVSPLQEILAATISMFSLLVSLPSHLYSRKENTQCAYAHDPCLLLPSIFLHSPNCISVSANPCIVPVCPLVKHDIDISLPKPNEHSNYLLYGYFSDNPPYSKSKKFLETKVAAMKLRGFYHSWNIKTKFTGEY